MKKFFVVLLTLLLTGLFGINIVGCDEDVLPGEEVYEDKDAPPGEQVYEDKDM